MSRRATTTPTLPIADTRRHRRRGDTRIRWLLLPLRALRAEARPDTDGEPGPTPARVRSDLARSVWAGRDRATLPGVDLEAFHEMATSLAGVRRTSASGRARWQSNGRLVARELDATHVVVRVSFDARDALMHQYPRVFSVPTRFIKHMMVVVDLAADDDGAVEDVLTVAWRLQR
jgi:hypothetical protein